MTGETSSIENPITNAPAPNTSPSQGQANILDTAEKIAQRMEQAERNIGIHVAQMREIESRRILGGQSQAGQARPIEKTDAEKAKEEADAFLRKSGLRK